MAQNDVGRFVVLPALNNFNSKGQTDSVKMSRTLSRIAVDPKSSGAFHGESDAAALLGGPVKVVERIDKEASIVELTEEQRLALTALYPGLIVRPEVRLRLLRPAPLRARLLSTRLPVKATSKRLEMIVVDDGGTPVKGVDIVVIFNLKRQSGADGLVTDDRGRVEIPLPGKLERIDLITANALSGFWPAVIKDVELAENGTTPATITLVPIADGWRDSLDLICSDLPGGAGKGVKIGIIDAGVSAPPGMNLKLGVNTTGSEDAALCDDNGSGHGTHVAGIIARLAPEAELYNYRVFAEGSDDAGEGAIARAIAMAVNEGCDLINLSLGQNQEAISITRELRRARSLGTMCVAAAGNDFNGEVTFPADSAHVLAVTACGHREGWPADTALELDIDDDPAPVEPIFFAAFSNYGRDVDFIMPGSGIISAVSPVGRGVMSGTSMAAPAATGMIARLLSKDARLLDQKTPRDQARSDDIAKLAGTSAVTVGFGALYEGRGLIGRK